MAGDLGEHPQQAQLYASAPMSRIPDIHTATTAQISRSPDIQGARRAAMAQGVLGPGSLTIYAPGPQVAVDGVSNEVRDKSRSIITGARDPVVHSIITARPCGAQAWDRHASAIWVS